MGFVMGAAYMWRYTGFSKGPTETLMTVKKISKIVCVSYWGTVIAVCLLMRVVVTRGKDLGLLGG